MEQTPKKEHSKEDMKKFFTELKGDFSVAVKDKKRWLLCGLELLIIGLILLVDQLTKKFIYGYCDTEQDIKIIDGVIRFTAVRNTGASFGMLSNSTTTLTVISVISACVLILFLFYTYPRRNGFLRTALIMIAGGAVGNIIDRLAFGYVRDFVYFELIDFAVFNLADSSLVIGTILLIIYIIFFYTKEEDLLKERRAAAAAEQNQTATADLGIADAEESDEAVEYKTDAGSPENTEE